jgi:hypothetical protein
MWFQHDGDPAHYGEDNQEGEVEVEGWFAWSPRSPELSPMELLPVGNT